MLYSTVNMKLRDEGINLDEFCAEYGVDKKTLTDKMNAAGFEYLPDANQFR